MMKDKKIVKIVIALVLIICGSIFLLSKPWEVTINNLIVSDEMNINTKQEVYLLGDEEYDINEASMKVNFVTYIPDLKELQFGYRIRTSNNDKLFNYMFVLRGNNGETVDEFQMSPSSRLIYTYYRVSMPIDIGEVDELFLDVYSDDDQFISSIQILKGKDGMKKISYDYSDGDYEFVD